MRKRTLIIVYITLFVLLIAINCYLGLKYTGTNKAIDKAVEEFKFDYDEEILTKTVKTEDDYYIVTIYGERTLVTYIYKNGEIYNYENQSN